MKRTPGEEILETAKKPTMTPTELLALRMVMNEKLTIARDGGQQKKVDTILKRIDTIDMMLDTILFDDLEATLPTLKIDIDMFTPAEIKAIIPGWDASRALMPGQTTIDFEVVEEVVKLITEDEPKPGVRVAVEGEDIVTQLSDILKKNFVSEIPKAVERYREITGCKDPDGVVWVKISKLLSDNRLIPIWHGSVRNVLLEKGSVPAFWNVKKHLKGWSDLDIAIVVNNAAMAGLETVAASKYESTRYALDAQLESAPLAIKALAVDHEIIDIIRQYLGLPLGKKVPNGDLIKSLTTITDFCAPSKRADIVKRPKYVEMGYPQD